MNKKKQNSIQYFEAKFPLQIYYFIFILFLKPYLEFFHIFLIVYIYYYSKLVPHFQEYFHTS